MRRPPPPAPPRNVLLPAGATVGRYQIQRRLSQGGFGVVYLARRADGHQVAIKEFLPAVLPCRLSGVHVHCSAADAAERFEQGLAAFFREADTLAQVHNPRIIPVWDVFRANGTAYFVMPVERGGTLQALLKSTAARPSEEALRALLVEACLGVEFLHAHGCLHLDIKPSNLWVRPDGSVLVLDLGASRWEDEEMQVSQMARTPGFAAPEQHGRFAPRPVAVAHRSDAGSPGFASRTAPCPPAGSPASERPPSGAGAPPAVPAVIAPPHRSAPIGPRTDVYGLAATLYTCLAGRAPPEATRRTAADPPIGWTLATRVSPALIQVVSHGLALRPEMRPPTVATWRALLAAVPDRAVVVPEHDEALWPSAPPSV